MVIRGLAAFLIAPLIWSALVVAQAALSFAARIDVPIGSPGCDPDCSDVPFDVATGDFDGDGVLDVATANNATDDVTILLGIGAGTLTVFGSFPADVAPVAIAAGDIDGNFVLDLVVANEFGDTVTILLGNGDGSFDPGGNLPVGLSPEGIVLAHFNDDESLDVATANLFDDTVSVLLGNGDGTFQDPVAVTVEGGPFDLAVSASDAGLVTVLLGDGSGGFAVGGSTPVGDTPVGLIIVDVDDDENADVVVANEFADTVSVLPGRGDGTFEPAQDYVVGGFLKAVAAADFNDDDIIDLATVDSFGALDFDSSTSVLLGRGDGTFDQAQFFEVGLGPFGIVVADLNSDQQPDIVTANSEGAGVSVLINTTGGSACTGDCDGDGAVTINELISGVRIALGQSPIGDCPEFDSNGNDMVDINELVAGVGNAQNGCPVL